MSLPYRPFDYAVPCPQFLKRFVEEIIANGGRIVENRSSAEPVGHHVHIRPNACSFTDTMSDEDLGKRFNNELHSDLVLNVDGKRFYAHKNMLANRSEYFQMMLSIDMCESTKQEISIVESNVNLFEKLLRYLYTGQFEFTTQPNVNEAIEMLTMANKYLFMELQRSIEKGLELVLTMENIFTIYSAAYFCSAESLLAKCLIMADQNQRAIFRAHEFSNLHVGAIKELITRESFVPYQPEVFTAVSEWISTNGGKVKCAKAADILLSEIQLHRIPTRFLAEIVRPSGFFSDARILESMAQRLQMSDKECWDYFSLVYCTSK